MNRSRDRRKTGDFERSCKFSFSKKKCTMKSIYLLIILILVSCSKTLQVSTAIEKKEPFYSITFINKSLKPYEIYLLEGRLNKDLWSIDGRNKKEPFTIEYNDTHNIGNVEPTYSHGGNIKVKVINYSDSFTLNPLSKKKIKVHFYNMETRPDSILVNMITKEHKGSFENKQYYIK